MDVAVNKMGKKSCSLWSEDSYGEYRQLKN